MDNWPKSVQNLSKYILCCMYFSKYGQIGLLCKQVYVNKQKITTAKIAFQSPCYPFTYKTRSVLDMTHLRLNRGRVKVCRFSL